MSASLVRVLPLILLIAATSVRGDDFETTIRPLLTAQCLDCHNRNTHEGGIDLSQFESTTAALAERGLWKRVFDAVEAGQMPLKDSGYRLSSRERQALLEFTESLQSRPDPKLGALDPGKPILRRLTRLEYNNSVRDLFELECDIFAFPERLPIADKSYFVNARGTLGPTLQTAMREYGQKTDLLLPQAGLPGDNRAEYGYANRGDALNMSPLLIENYLETAAAIARSERLERESPAMARLLGIELKGSPAPTTTREAHTASETAASARFAPQDNVAADAPGNDIGRQSFREALAEAYELGRGGVFGVPAAMSNATVSGKGGIIRLAIGAATLTINPDIDLWLAGFATASETSGELLLTNKSKGQKSFELVFHLENTGDENGIEHLGVCVLARRGQSGAVSLTAVFANGTEVTRRAEIAEGNVFFSFSTPPGSAIRRLKVDGSEFGGDYVLLDDLAFVLKSGTGRRELPPEESQVAVAPSRKPLAVIGPPAPLDQRVQQFLTRAYRRPASADELSTALSRIADDRRSGLTEADSLKRFVQATLTSPEFLFLAEPIVASAPSVRQLDGFEIATRLSYFLWSSLPDDELLAAAASGQLATDDGLRTQTRRMLLERSRSRELAESFATQWLRLDQLYAAKPDPRLFKPFYAGPQGKSTLHAAMLTEALLLFETVLVEDRSVLDLINADYTWLNASLARLYDLDEAFTQAQSAAGQTAELSGGKTANSWLRVSLPDRSRGGVLTMAGPLTLTSLPNRTSPVKRGAWLLETVFHRPPAEPKVAFVLEERSSGGESLSAQTVRQRFEQHRSDPNCFSCHSRIDPPGFSLETFDAIGALRTHDGSQPVDATGTWNDVAFNGPAEFKTAVRRREREFIRGFVEHLMSYGLGREIEHFDMPAITKIVDDAAAADNRLSTIIEGIVCSYPFRHTRNVPGDAP